MHPNMYENGKLCLSILGTWQGPGWLPTMTIETIGHTISSLLDSNPLNNEPGFVNSTVDRKDNQNFINFVE